MRPIEIHRILNLVAILVAKHVIDQVTLILAANFAARLVSTTAVTSRPLLVAWIATREAEGKNLSEISTQNVEINYCYLERKKRRIRKQTTEPPC